VCELPQKGKDSERILRVARLPLGGDAGQGHVWSLRDVTQQKLAEQTRDRFIDTATHELRTPLANIKAYAETLASAEYIDVELQKEFCNIINSEVTRLARFIDDLLSISSMEAGALTVERQKVETDRLFAEVLAKVEPLMQKKEIQFEVELPPKMPELHLDKDKIIAVVVNVLGNAAKYTPNGGRVSLKVKCEEGRLRAAVQDTGVGIAEEELPKVFEKFFRSEDPRVQAEVGTGLGLSLAREVVRMHGGEITVESELNKGSTFTVSLPLT
jgi:two-component system phosphate regulon sensor histidine kinase PhoR